MRIAALHTQVADVRRMRTGLAVSVCVLPAVLSVGCGGEATAPPPISISIAPDPVPSLAAGGTQVFAATLTNDPGAKGVTWSITGCAGGPGNCGTLTGVTSTSATYVAPTPVPSAVHLGVTATAVADPTRSAAVGVALVPVGVEISPASAYLDTNVTQVFSATVANDPSEAGVTWSITGCPDGPPACGSLTGVTATTASYQAPGAVPSGILGITAISIADPSKSATANVRVVAVGVGAGRIAFTSSRGTCVEIWVMDADGSGVTQLSNQYAILHDSYCGANANGAAWSPDGAKIAFDYTSAGNVSPTPYAIEDIFVMDASGGGAQRLNVPTDPKLYGRLNPAWSPDGTKLAARGEYVTCCDPNTGRNVLVNRIIIMDPDGSGLVDLGVSGDEPAWSPDGRRLAFSDSSGRVVVMNADGTNLVPLFRGTGPAWSPDGTRIAFRHDSAGQTDIFVMNADGSGATPLTSGAASRGRPAWSPDGTMIAFASNRDIYVMYADGSGMTRLTSNGYSYRPAWTR